MRKKLAICISALALTVSGPAFAAKKIDTPPAPVTVPDCSVVSFSVAALGCSGFFEGNLVSGGGPKETQALGIVDDLDPLATSLLEKIEWKGSMPSDIINFNTLLSGKTVIGLHFGGGKNGYNGTAFWLFDLPDNLDKISWSSNVQSGISNAGLYLTSDPREVPGPQGAVPEPSTWAMMLFGFGAIGFGMRRRKFAQPRVNYTFA